jgi:hypothetical protein
VIDAVRKHRRRRYRLAYGIADVSLGAKGGLRMGNGRRLRVTPKPM